MNRAGGRCGSWLAAASAQLVVAGTAGAGIIALPTLTPLPPPPPVSQGCFNMTQVDAARHLGFGSSTVLKKVGNGEEGCGQGGGMRHAGRAAGGTCLGVCKRRPPLARLHLTCVSSPPPPLLPRQVMRRLGIKQWPYRKRTSAKKITCSLEVRGGGQAARASTTGWAAVASAAGQGCAQPALSCGVLDPFSRCSARRMLAGVHAQVRRPGQGGCRAGARPHGARRLRGLPHRCAPPVASASRAAPRRAPSSCRARRAAAWAVALRAPPLRAPPFPSRRRHPARARSIHVVKLSPRRPHRCCYRRHPAAPRAGGAAPAAVQAGQQS